ncbi:MAG TPA: hypothetical protein VG056_09870 [Pirellulales bacterium]|nr:hypothetical protein [Pirellulales bacterium]
MNERCVPAQVSRWLLASLGLAAAVLVAAQSVRADDPFSEAAAFLPNNGYKFDEILEGAVQQVPTRVVCWTQLLHHLGFDDRFAAQCMSREAIKANPKSPELLFARAGLLEKSPAIDVMTQIEQFPAAAEAAREGKETLSLGLGVVEPCAAWAEKLVQAGRWARAEEIIHRALPLHPNDPNLWECDAVVLTEEGHFWEALEAQKTAQSHCLPNRRSDFHQIGEVLLEKGHPELAVKSFEGYVPDEPRDVDALIFAEALVRTGDDAGAENILAKCDVNGANLLRLAHLLENGKANDAQEVGKKLASCTRRYLIGSDFTYHPLWNPPKSLAKPFATAGRWLIKDFPDDASNIKRILGDPDAKRQPEIAETVLPSSELIPSLIKQLEHADTLEEQWKLRSRLAWELRDAERYTDAARGYRINIFAPRPSYYREERFPSEAVDWCMCTRRADAVRYFSGHLGRIIAARRTVHNIDGARSDPKRIDGQEWLTLDEVIARLKLMDHGVLALVFDALQACRDDPTPYVRIIEKIGTERDTPVLINMLVRLSYTAEARAKANSSNPESSYTDDDSKLAAVLNHAMEELTNRKNPAESRSERLKFWLSWWNTNARRIVRDE